MTNTMLGPLNVQWDFSDYRDVSLIRTSDVASYDTVIRRFSVIKIDSSLNENVFDILEGLQARKMWRRGRLRRSHQRSEICQRIDKPHDKTFCVYNAFNAELFVTPPHAVAMKFDLFGRGGVVIELRAGGTKKENF